MSALSLTLMLSLTAPAQADPKPVIEKAIQAYGGEAKLANLKAIREKSKGTVDILGMSVSFTGVSVVQFPGQTRQDLSLDVMGQKLQIIQVYDNGKGWTKALGMLKNLEGDELDDMKAEFHYARVSTLVPLLKDKDFKLALIGEDKIDGKPVVGVKVSAKGCKDIDLYFDKASGLIVKSVRTGRDSTTMKEAKWESFYSDFKDHNGLKHATKAKILQDGAKFIDAEVTEFEILDKVDEKEFAKPGKDA